jgi:hypothetical protein
VYAKNMQTCKPVCTFKPPVLGLFLTPCGGLLALNSVHPQAIPGFAGFKQLASYKYANPTGNPRANMLKVVVMDITPNPPAIPTNAL